MKKITLMDIIIIIFFLILILLVILTQIFKKNSNKKLVIQTKTEKYYYKIDSKKEISINGVLGLTKISIEKSKFKFKDSICKNKICVHSGWVDLQNYPVICLPNQVSAYISDDENQEIDGISR